MEEIFETLREQIKGDFDQNNIIIILDNSISLTCKNTQFQAPTIALS